MEANHREGRHYDAATNDRRNDLYDGAANYGDELLNFAASNDGRAHFYHGTTKNERNR